MSVYKSLKAYWRGIRQVRKDTQLNVAKFLLDRQISDDEFCAENAKRVLLLRWDDKLGDCVMSTLLLNALKKYRPDIEVTCVVGNVSAVYLEGSGLVDRIEVVGRRGWNAARQLSSLAGNYDLVIEPTSGMSAYELYALRQLRGRHYVGYMKDAYSLFDLEIPEESIHFSERYLFVARMLCGAVDSTFYLPDAAKERVLVEGLAKSFLTPKKKLVLVNLFAAGRHRCFNEQQAVDLVQWWLDTWHDQCLIILIVPGKEDFVARVVSSVNHPRVMASPVDSSFAMTVALIERSDLLFSPDTFVIHLASALNAPVVSVFSQDEHNYAAWRPLGDKVRVVFTARPKSRKERVSVSAFSREELREAIDAVLL